MEGFIKNLTEIFSHPTSLAALLGVVILIFVLIRVRKVKLDARTIAYMGMALALAAVLHILKLYQFPEGGSVTMGSMVPLLLMAFLFGPEVGFLTGFVFGLISLMIEPYILHPIQVLFDYPLPFMALGLAGYFRSRKPQDTSNDISIRLLGTFAAIFARFIFHIISGVVFFAQYAPEGTSPLIYSIVYNGSYLAIDAAICLIIIGILPVNRLKRIINSRNL